MPTQTFTISTNYPTPNEILLLTLELFLPEGLTRNLTTIIDAWDTNRTFDLDIKIDSVTLGSNINSSSMEIM